MQHNNQIISYLQANDILAKKLDHAFHGVSNAVSHQIETVGAGLQRALFYTSCFTTEYQTVCQQQRSEDARFAIGAIKILGQADIVKEMLKIYFEEIFRYKTNSQLDYIKKSLMALNVHIAASHLTQYGFVLVVAAVVAAGMKFSLNMSALVGARTGSITAALGVYGVIQKAADCASKLHFSLPAYYAALYSCELEMMYFLIDPLFERSGALKGGQVSDKDIINIIVNMIR